MYIQVCIQSHSQHQKVWGWSRNDVLCCLLLACLCWTVDQSSNHAAMSIQGFTTMNSSLQGFTEGIHNRHNSDTCNITRGGHSNTHCNHKCGCEFFLNRSLQNELFHRSWSCRPRVKLMDGARKLCHHMTAVSLLWVLTCAEYRQHACIAILHAVLVNPFTGCFQLGTHITILLEAIPLKELRTRRT